MNTVQLPIKKGRNLKIKCKIDVNIPYKKNYSIDTKKKVVARNFKFDTGASITCLPALDLGIEITEEEFKRRFNFTLEVKCTGIDKDSDTVTYYLIQVENFVIYNIDLGSVPIYITFDSRAPKRLLGMDLIKLLNIDFNMDTGFITLSKSQRLIEFSKRKLRLEVNDMYEMGIYDISDAAVEIDFSEQTNAMYKIVDKYNNPITTDEEFERDFYD